jgi:hypothetical protein
MNRVNIASLKLAKYLLIGVFSVGLISLTLLLTNLLSKSQVSANGPESDPRVVCVQNALGLSNPTFGSNVNNTTIIFWDAITNKSTLAQEAAKCGLEIPKPGNFSDQAMVSVVRAKVGQPDSTNNFYRKVGVEGACNPTNINSYATAGISVGISKDDDCNQPELGYDVNRVIQPGDPSLAGHPVTEGEIIQGISDGGIDMHTALICNPACAAPATPTPTAVPNACIHWASNVASFSQGKNQDGTPVRSHRSDPAAAVGVLDDGREVHYVSLGYGGQIVLGFDKPIFNGAGNDITIYEASSQGHPLETADVYVSDNKESWTKIGTANNNAGGTQGDHKISSSLDLGSVASAKFVKVVDTTDINRSFEGQGFPDAFDLSAVEATQCQPANPTPTPGGNTQVQNNTQANNQTQNVTVNVPQPQVIGVASSPITTLPKTGLPLAALALLGLLPAGAGIKRLTQKDNSEEVSANSIWEERELSK